MVVGCGCVRFFVCFISAAVVIKAGEFRNISGELFVIITRKHIIKRVSKIILIIIYPNDMILAKIFVLL